MIPTSAYALSFELAENIYLAPMGRYSFGRMTIEPA